MLLYQYFLQIKTLFPFQRLLLTGSFALPIAFLFGASCAQFDTITGPLGGCLRRAAIISVDIPPITLTPSRTAAERQLIGENQELEKKGRLLGSTRSTQSYAFSNNEKSAQPATEHAREYYRQQSVLEFYSEYVEYYKNEELIGESYKGFLQMVPSSVSKASVRRDQAKNAQIVIEAVNQTRSRLMNLSQSGKQWGENPVPFDPLQYYKRTIPGHWRFTKDGWVKTK